MSCSPCNDRAPAPIPQYPSYSTEISILYTTPDTNPLHTSSPNSPPCLSYLIPQSDASACASVERRHTDRLAFPNSETPDPVGHQTVAHPTVTQLGSFPESEIATLGSSSDISSNIFLRSSSKSGSSSSSSGNASPSASDCQTHPHPRQQIPQPPHPRQSSLPIEIEHSRRPLDTHLGAMGCSWAAALEMCDVDALRVKNAPTRIQKTTTHTAFSAWII